MSQPRVAGVDEGDRFPEPLALFFVEVGEKGEEVGLVLGAAVLQFLDGEVRRGLVEEDDFRDDCGQTPGGLLGTSAQRHGDAGLAAEDPVAAGALVEENFEAEAVVRAGVDVGGEIEAASVPGLGSVARDVGVVGDQLPAGEMIEDGVLVVLKDGDIDVRVVVGLTAEPGVDGPAAAEGPFGTEGGHEVGDASEWFWDGGHRLAARCAAISAES